MAGKPPSNVDQWLKRETPRTRKALESASNYFDGNDHLTVNTLEAVYGQESSFGTMLGTRGSAGAAGHFHLKPDTARRYGLSVSKNNDQRFNLDYASSAAARYLKDLNTMFSEKTTLLKGVVETSPVKSASERKTFTLGAYNAGEGRVATAQQLAEKAGKNPALWSDVEPFLESAGAEGTLADQTRQYVRQVPLSEAEFAQKSLAKKQLKQKAVNKGTSPCSDGHWVTIDSRPVFICD